MPAASAVRTFITEAAGAALVTVPRLAPGTFSGWLLKLIDAAVDGVGKVPGAKQTAARALERQQDVDRAIESLVRLHVGLASAQGFVTNVGGGLAALAGMPANLTGIVIVQIRLAAAIAHLHGWDTDDPRVRTALVMCLLGERKLQAQIAAGNLPSSPIVVATAPVHDAGLASKVAEKVLGDVLSDLGTKDLVGLVVRRIPLLGGGVGAVADAYSTAQVARTTRQHLVNRRPALTEAHRPGAQP